MAVDLPAGWQTLKRRYGACSQREKLLLIGVMLALVVGLWDSLVHLPMQTKAASLNEQQQRTQQQTQQMAQAISLMQSQVGESPADRQKRLANLKQQSSAREQQLQDASSGLVTPQHMAAVLKRVLQQTDRVRLIRMQSLPPEKWLLPGLTDRHEWVGPVVYQHGIELQIEGDYFAVLDYIKRVESIMGFYWDDLDYQVQQWPRASVRLRLHTLGLEEAMLGA